MTLSSPSVCKIIIINCKASSEKQLAAQKLQYVQVRMINEVHLCGILGLLWLIINEADIVTSETKGAGFLWTLCEFDQWLILVHYDVCSTPDVHIACVVIWILLLISWI